MKRLSKEEFIQRSVKVHGNRYDYSNVVYVNAHTNVEIICEKHGPFWQEPSNHMKGWGCLRCNKVEKRRLGVDEFIVRSKSIHGNKYDYSKVIYVNNKTPVEIICSQHGSFWQRPEKHLIGHICPFCCKNFKDTTKSFIEKARKVHGSLYDYSKVDYVDQHTKVCIIDPIFGEFWQEPISHLNGRGCPFRKGIRCNITKKKNNSLGKSKKEDEVYNYLVQKFGSDDIIRHYSSILYPFACDFYIKSLDLYIEFNAFVSHGGHWFDSSNSDDLDRLNCWQQKSVSSEFYKKMIYTWTELDLRKRQKALDNNLNYVVFWNNNLSDFLLWYNNFDNNPILKQF